MSSDDPIFDDDVFDVIFLEEEEQQEKREGQPSGCFAVMLLFVLIPSMISLISLHYFIG